MENKNMNCTTFYPFTKSTTTRKGIKVKWIS